MCLLFVNGALIIYVKWIFICIFLKIIFCNMLFLLKVICFGNNWNKNQQMAKENLITHAIKNLKNNCTLKLVEIIKYVWIHSINTFICLTILILIIHLFSLFLIKCNIIETNKSYYICSIKIISYKLFQNESINNNYNKKLSNTNDKT